jgi:AcrR family transcriptional regulator
MSARRPRDRPSGPARRVQILEAAASVFAERGYQRATIKEIAACADVSPGTIYLYFKNKRELLLTMANRLTSQALSETAFQLTRLAPEAYLPAVLEGFLDFIQRNGPLLQAVVSEIWTDRELREQFLAQVVAPVFDTGARYLERQVAAGTARPCRADVVIPAVSGSLFVISMLQVMGADHLLGNCATADVIEELTQFYMYGLGGSTAPPGEPPAIRG